MANVFLDMRCSTVRYLVTDGDTVLCCGSVDGAQDSNLSAQAASGDRQKLPSVHGAGPEIGDILKQAARESGAKIQHAHLIVSMGEVKSGVHKLQAMPWADMEKVIARKLSAEQGEKSPAFCMTPLVSGSKSQICLVESMSRDAVRKYVRAFSAGKVRLGTISTSLATTLQACEETTRQLPGTHAVFYINRDFLEALYVSNTELVHYERIEFTPDQDDARDAETEDAGTAERIHRRWLYRVITTIYTVHSGYMSGNAALPVERVWLSGQVSGDDGIAEALKESMDADVMPADNLPGLPAHGHELLALAGLARAVAGGDEVNLIPQDILQGRRLTRDHLVGTAAAAAVAIMLTGGVYTELKHDRLAAQVAREKKEIAAINRSAAEFQAYARNLDALKKLMTAQVPFYGLFRELADRLPDGVHLEKMEYRQNGDTSQLKFTAATPYQPDIGRKRILSRLVAATDNSGYLRRTADPVIAVNGRDKDRMVEITLECEVGTREAIR